MSRNTTARFVKPMLEKLEERALPSFLLQGAVQQMVTPLNAMVTDMQTARGNLQAVFQLLHTPSGLTNAQAENDYGVGTASWQRMLNDQHAIQATVTADTNFLHAAAFAELAEGDPTDAILLTFGPIIGFNPTNALTNEVTQANNLANDPAVQTWVNTDFFSTSPLFTHQTFAQETQTPGF